MSYELAKAYIQIVPTTKDFKSQLTSALGTDITSAGEEQGTSFGDSFGSAAQVAIAAAATAIAAAATTALKSIIETGSEYETAFAQVQTIMDETQMSTDDMSAAILELSSDMGIAASDIASTVYNAISATGDTANAVELVAQASELATAGFTDTDSALSVLTTTINAYGMEAADAEAISDSLIMVQNLGVTTVSELASAMGKAISTASAYSVDLGNLESAYVSLTKAGISTEESTTYLSSMLNELGDTGSDVAAIIEEETGQSFSELMDSGYSLGDVLGILYEACDEDSTALMNLWSSAEAGKASNAIVSQGLEEFNENLEAIEGSAGATAEAYETMADTLEVQSEKFSTAGQNLMIALYDGMSGSLADVVGIATDAVTQITEAYEEDGVAGMLDVGMDLIVGLMEGIADEIPELIASLPEIITAIVEFITEHLPEIVSAGGDILVSIAEGIVEMIPELVAALPEIISAIVLGIADLLYEVTEAGAGITQAIIDGTLSLIAEVGNAALEIGTALLTSFVEAVAPIATETVNLLLEVTASAVSWGADIASEFLSIGKNVIQGLINGITSMVSSLYESIKSALSGLVDKAKSALGISSPSKVFAEIGAYTAQGLEEGFEGAMDDVSDAVAGSLQDMAALASSEAGSAMQGIADTLSDASIDATARVSATVAADALTIGARQADASVVDSGQGYTYDQLRALTAMLAEYLPQLLAASGQAIVLDTGALVGETAPAINTALGKLYKREARSV